MSKYTPFSLFIRQALLYPLASPFLPPVLKVQNGFSYANGALVGLMLSEIESTERAYPPLNQHDAAEYCMYLMEDGITLSEIHQMIWTLPDVKQLAYLVFRSIYDQLGQSFIPYTPYWTSQFIVEGYNYAIFVHEEGVGVIEKLQDSSARFTAIRRQTL